MDFSGFLDRRQIIEDMKTNHHTFPKFIFLFKVILYLSKKKKQKLNYLSEKDLLVLILY